MNSYNWLLKKLNKKFIFYYLTCILISSLIWLSINNNQMILYNILIFSFLISKLYYQQFVRNNFLSILILENNPKHFINNYIYNLIKICLIPIFVGTLFLIIFYYNYCMNVIEILKTLLALFIVIVFLYFYNVMQFIINKKYKKISDFCLYFVLSCSILIQIGYENKLIYFEILLLVVFLIISIIVRNKITKIRMVNIFL